MSDRPDAGMFLDSIRALINDELLDHPDVEGYAAEDELREALDHIDAADVDVSRGERGGDDE